MSRTVDPFDELASMFLTDEEASVSGELAAAPAPVELLIVGHLPVRAGLWLTPYADAVARKAGPVALLRLDGEEPVVQVLRGDDDSSEMESCPTLRDAVAHLAGLVRAWIIRPAIEEKTPNLLAGGADRITILTGANQAAVVAAYRLVKDLVEAAGQADIAPPQIGLAVIGADADGAEEVVEPLNRTTRQCLDVSVPLVLCLPRMDADIRTTAFRSFPGEAGPALKDVIGWIAQAPPRAAAPSAAPSVAQGNGEPETQKMTIDGTDRAEEFRPMAAVEADALRHPAAEKAEPVPQPAWEPIGPGESAEVIRITAEPRVEAAAANPQAPEPNAPTPQEETEVPALLASHVLGLEPIKPRCPGHEQVELAVGAEGRIHLLTREYAVLELRIVEAWVRAHYELLAMACPEHQLHPSREVICHVFTDEPARVADLHATDLHLHVLAPVEIEGKRGWYAAPLNRPG